MTASHRDAVRSRILDAAQRLVSRRGIHGTSMDDIVGASGLSKGAIYGHFSSKEELLISLQDRELASKIDEVTRRFRSSDSPRARIVRLLEAYFATGASANRERLRLNLEFFAAALGTKSLRARLDARYARSRRLFIDLLELGVRRNEFRPDLDCEATATAIVALLDGVSVDWALISSLHLDWHALGAATRRALLDGIAADSSPPSGSTKGPASARATHRRVAPRNLRPTHRPFAAASIRHAPSALSSRRPRQPPRP
ncbi:MAG: TetR/AcrR family transcriptional regulator [Thermoplasmata archaeon]